MNEEEAEELLNQLQEELGPALKGFMLLEVSQKSNRFATLSPTGEIVPASLLEWAQFMETDRTIFFDRFGEGAYLVSTIFLGLNHQFGPEGPPLWFETMVFGPPREQEVAGKKLLVRPSLWCRRTSTREEALATHQEGIQWLKIYRLGPGQ